MRFSGRDRFFELLRTAVANGTLVKLTLGKHRGPDATLRNVFVRPVTLKSGPHLAFVWRHTTHDETRNFASEHALAEIDRLVGATFLDAHLFTTGGSAQLETQPDGSARLKTSTSPHRATANAQHDRQKSRLIPTDASWLRALGVTNDRGQPREGMADKFRQIEKFAELLSHLLGEAFPDLASRDPHSPLQIADMGSGKGYLTFAVAALLGERARVRGIEARRPLVDLANRVAEESGLAPRLSFAAGSIADASVDAVDVLIALHACDTATDDALARGIAAGAQLLVVAPCCQKELRPQIKAPQVLSDALRHGIFEERQAEFATDALRAQLLEWAGYRTRVFEFISTEHTAKNVMIAAVKRGTGPDEAAATRIREFAAFYGIRTQALARQLGFSLAPIPRFVPEVSP